MRRFIFRFGFLIKFKIFIGTKCQTVISVYMIIFTTHLFSPTEYVCSSNLLYYSLTRISWQVNMQHTCIWNNLLGIQNVLKLFKFQTPTNRVKPNVQRPTMRKKNIHQKLIIVWLMSMKNIIWFFISWKLKSFWFTFRNSNWKYSCWSF